LKVEELLEVVESPKVKKTIGSCGAITNEKATNLSTEDLLLAFNLIVEFLRQLQRYYYGFK
jgi:hypothetical protein